MRTWIEALLSQPRTEDVPGYGKKGYGRLPDASSALEAGEFLNSGQFGGGQNSNSGENRPEAGREDSK